jgi:WD40 repeat protein
MRSEDNAVKVVDIPGKNCVLTLHDQDSFGRRLAFSADSQFLALSKGKQHMAVYNFLTEALAKVECTANLRAIAFHPDEQHLAAASLDRVQVFQKPRWTLHNDRCKLHATAVAFLPDGRLVAFSQYAKIKLLRLPTLAIYRTITTEGWTQQVGFSHDGCWFLTEHGALSVSECGASLPASQAGTSVSYDIKGA